MYWLSLKKMTLLIGNVKVKNAYDIPLFKAEMNCKWNHLLTVAAAVLEEAMTALLCTVQVKTKHSMFQPALVRHGHISNKLKYRENTVTWYCPSAHTNRRHPSSPVVPTLPSHHAESIPKSRPAASSLGIHGGLFWWFEFFHVH